MIAVFAGAWIWSFPAYAAGEEHCRERWPGNFRMQKYCIEQQNAGAKNVYAWMSAYGAAARDGANYSFDPDKVQAGLDDGKPWAQIAMGCFKKWSGNWRMIDYCLDQQTKAALSMGVQLDP